jgi:hypothetical protein
MGNVVGLGRVGKRCGGIAPSSLPKAHKTSHRWRKAQEMPIIAA